MGMLKLKLVQLEQDAQILKQMKNDVDTLKALRELRLSNMEEDYD